MIMKWHWFFFLWVGWVASPLWSESLSVSSSSAKENSHSPLQQPQLSVLGGNRMNGKFRFHNIGSNDIELQGSIDTTEVREVDLEIYGGRGFTIGVYGRFEDGKVRFTKIKTLKGELASQGDYGGKLFRTTIGGFVRGQYPVTSHMGLFAKGEIGGGPYITGFAGFTFDGAAQVGVDYYFSDWWGMTASYGYIASYGIETYESKQKSFKSAFGKKPLFFSANGNLLLIGIKSTYL